MAAPCTVALFFPAVVALLIGAPGYGESWSIFFGFGEQWKNGSSLICNFFDRNDMEVFSLLEHQSEKFKSDYKDLCVRWYEACRQTKSCAERNGLAIEFKDLRVEAGKAMNHLFGRIPSQRKHKKSSKDAMGYVDGVSAFGKMGGTDPLAEHLVALQLQHKQQKKMLVARLKSEQEAERRQLEEHLISLKQRREKAARETEKVHVMLERARQLVESVKNGVTHVTGAGNLIDSIMAETHAVIASLAEFSDGEVPVSMRRELERIAGNAQKIKLGLGSELKKLDMAFYSASSAIDGAEDYANKIGVGFREVREGLEPLLRAAAQYRVSLSSLEAVVKESILSLERKQQEADAVLEELHTTLDSVMIQTSRALKARIGNLLQYLNEFSIRVHSVLTEDLTMLTQRINLEIERTGGPVVDWSSVTEAFEEISQAFVVWTQRVEQSKNSIDDATDATHSVLEEVRGLPRQYQRDIDIKAVEEAIESFSAFKASLRTAIAEVNGQMQLFKAVYDRGIRGFSQTIPTMPNPMQIPTCPPGPSQYQLNSAQFPLHNPFAQSLEQLNKRRPSESSDEGRYLPDNSDEQPVNVGNAWDSDASTNESTNR